MLGGWDIKRILSSDFFCFYFSVYIFVQNKKTYLWQKKKSIR